MSWRRPTFPLVRTPRDEITVYEQVPHCDSICNFCSGLPGFKDVPCQTVSGRVGQWLSRAGSCRVGQWLSHVRPCQAQPSPILHCYRQCLGQPSPSQCLTFVDRAWASPAPRPLTSSGSRRRSCCSPPRSCMYSMNYGLEDFSVSDVGVSTRSFVLHIISTEIFALLFKVSAVVHI